ncbi:MAG: hypothetical protein IJ809_06770 [Clostridia bacterium]|nr:hypothetical protein [Clostridia bacterium]
MDKMRLIALYDIYGKLLTKNQAKMFESYYMEDLSLREIAVNEYVTFQAVRSALKTAENRLEKFEKTIHMYETKENLRILEEKLKKENNLSDEIYEIISKMK